MKWGFFVLFCFVYEWLDCFNSSSYSEIYPNHAKEGDEEMPPCWLNFHNSESSSSYSTCHLPLAIATTFQNPAATEGGPTAHQAFRMQTTNRCYKEGGGIVEAGGAWASPHPQRDSAFDSRVTPGLSLFFFFFGFLGPYLQHMEGARPGIESKL